MNPQLDGLGDVSGTYIFDLRASQRALKLNRFFWKMTGAEARAAFVADEDKAMSEAGLTDEEKKLVGARDWIGLIRHGAIFFVLEKFARVAGKTNLEVYAMMRGESFDDFMKTRRVPDAR